VFGKEAFPQRRREQVGGRDRVRFKQHQRESVTSTEEPMQEGRDGQESRRGWRPSGGIVGIWCELHRRPSLRTQSASSPPTALPRGEGGAGSTRLSRGRARPFETHVGSGNRFKNRVGDAPVLRDLPQFLDAVAVSQNLRMAGSPRDPLSGVFDGDRAGRPRILVRLSPSLANQGVMLVYCCRWETR
jgi:hypothetical protein